MYVQYVSAPLPIDVCDGRDLYYKFNIQQNIIIIEARVVLGIYIFIYAPIYTLCVQFNFICLGWWRLQL